MRWGPPSPRARRAMIAALGLMLAACSAGGGAETERRSATSEDVRPAASAVAPAAAPTAARAPVATPAPAPAAPAAPAPDARASTPPPGPPPGAHPCEQGIAVPSPSAQAELVGDCTILLALKEELQGDAELDWSAERPMSHWEGIDVVRGRVAYIYLVRRGLTGRIPPGIAGLTGLNQLVLWENELSGPIPPELGELTALWTLALSGNRLTGPIPPELGRLVNLESLELQGNRLTGRIPPELGALSRLRYLLLEGNRLVGAVPAGVAALPALDLVTLRDNPLARCLWPPGAAIADPPDALDLPDCTRPRVAETPPQLTPSQRIEFAGGVPAERQAELRAAVEDVAAYYALGHGIGAPEFRLYVAADGATAGALYEELTGLSWPFASLDISGVVSPTAEGPLAIIQDGYSPRFSIVMEHVLAHEYYHLFQYAAGGRAAVAPLPVPAWLVEGTAEYGAGLFLRDKYGLDAHAEWVAASVAAGGTFGELASRFELDHFSVAALAVWWLVEHAGDQDAHARYWERIAAGEGWQEAFVSSFKISPGAFFDSFEEYRQGLSSQTASMRGIVLDPEGRGIGGVGIGASPLAPYRRMVLATTDADGTFALTLPPDSYALVLGRRATGSPGVDLLRFDLHYDAGRGYVSSCGRGTEYEIRGGEELEVVIRVQPHLLELVDRPPCNEGLPGYHVIAAVVSGPDGEPVAPYDLGTGIQVKVVPYPYRVTGHRFDGFVGLSGSARAAVRDGLYLLEIRYSAGYGMERRRLVGWYGSDGFTTDRDAASVIEVEGASVEGIEIRLPADAEALPRLYW